MEETGKAVIIKTDGTKETIDWEYSTLLKTMQNAVDGYIELVVLNNHGIRMYCNEEGIRLGLDPNPLATQLYMEEYGLVPPVFGNVIILGPVDGEGDATGLSPEQIEVIYKHGCNISFAYYNESDESDLGDDSPPSPLDKFLQMEAGDAIAEAMAEMAEELLSNVFATTIDDELEALLKGEED